MSRSQILTKIKDWKTLPSKSNTISTTCVVGWNGNWRRNGSHFGKYTMHSNVTLSRNFFSTTSESTHLQKGKQQQPSTDRTKDSQNERNQHHRHNDDRKGHNNNFSSHWVTKACGISSAVLLGYYVFLKKFNYSPLSAASSLSEQERKTPQASPKVLKTYSKSEVSQHYNAEKRVWVTYKNGVYDVTDFISIHPGGNKILMAAGSSLEPFWELYPVHKRQDIFQILEKYRIGNLSEEDSVSEKVQENKSVDAFCNDPIRHSALIPRSLKPFNGETPPNLLTATIYTPNELFYVRNHLPVPEINIKNYELEVEGLNLPPQGKTFTLDDIKKLPRVEISATIQCGGNRRSNMGETKPVSGLAWSGGAIGTAKWTGARLKDVLKAAGFCLDKYESPEKMFIQFEGLDTDQSGESYGASIPLSYLLDDNFEGIIAYEMNGETIPLDHGYPIRVILPGIVGARSVKWLSRIIVSDEESQSPWQQRDYKVFSPSVTLETVDYSSSPAIMDTPITSYICSHENGQVVSKGNNSIQGYAFSGGGRDIIRVEISADKGKTWSVVPTLKSAEKSFTKNWSWVIWEATLELSQAGKQDIWVKAVDSGYNQQPENFESIWNYRGLLSNAYHKIQVTVSDK